MRLSLFKKNDDTGGRQPAERENTGTGGALLANLKKGLAKTRSILTLRIDDLILGKKEIDRDFMDQLEEILITADLSVGTSHKLIEQVQSRIKRGEAENPALVKQYLKESIHSILANCEKPLAITDAKPFVIMVAGINGTGKTTTIAKMAHHYATLGKKVLLVAADTFRAAAIEQLELWSTRTKADFVKQNAGADPSAVVHDALNAARNRDSDMVIIDTAGRMHTKTNLMEEIKKIQRVAARACPGAPHQTLLVIDATSGLNALSQARLFHESLTVSGIILTKLDGTSKGGIIVAIADELAIPIPYIGMGEGFADLKPFRSREFVDALFNEV